MVIVQALFTSNTNLDRPEQTSQSGGQSRISVRAEQGPRQAELGRQEQQLEQQTFAQPLWPESGVA
jgi:hypothetical protein